MRRWAQWAARLYPAAWRARYGSEFEALLEDATPCAADVFDILREAILMNLANVKAYARLAGLFGAAGALAAFGVSFAMPQWHRSSAVVTIAPAQAAAGPARVAAREHEITEELLSRSRLAEWITRPSLDLYRGQRASQPMVDVIELMRRDLRVRQTAPAGSAARIWAIEFDYPNAYKARAVVHEMAAGLTEAYVALRKEEGAEPDLQPGLAEPATPNDIVVWPNRLQVTGIGLAIGLLAGALAGTLHRVPRGLRLRAAFKVASFGAAGALLVFAASYAIPSTYVSSALVRARAGFPLEREAVAGPLLTELILRHGLYGGDPRAEAKLRRDLTIARVSPAGAREASYTISFAYPDRDKAYAIVHDVIATLNRWDRLPNVPNPPGNILPLNAKVIDPAFFPDLPAGPNRELLSLFGLVAGIAVSGRGWRSGRSPLRRAG